MTGELIFALLNPAISAVLIGTFLLLWRIRPQQRYFGLLAFGFLCSGIAFAANDFLQPWDGPALRAVVNLLFLVAVIALCVSVLVRVNAPIPLATFVTASGLCAVLFVWFLVVEPSTEGRIYTTNATLAVLGLSTTWQLVRAAPKAALDWMFVGLGGLLSVLAMARPAATMLKALDINQGGALQASDYWATVQAVTPILAVTIALAFFASWTAKALSDLRIEAHRDHLSGLLNRRGFDIGVDKAMRAGRRSSAVMLVDIDNFKQVNDRFGHQTGDQVIAATGRVLGLHGQTDLVGRTGGEEFALFYNNVGQTSLLSIADTLRDQFTRMMVAGLPSEHALTISIGIHACQQSESLAEMLEKADRALYQAKASGKDRAVIAPFPLKSVAAG